MNYISGYSNKLEIIKLWQECFGDEESYINLFLENYFKAEYCYGVTDEQNLVAMAFLLPISLLNKDTSFNGKYIYAVATGLNYRGKGISKKLLAFAEKEAEKEGVEFVTLVPATESLFDFYKSQGYNNYFYISNYAIKKEDDFKDLIKLKQAKIPAVNLVRKSFFSDTDSLAYWNNDFLRYIQKENAYLQGDILEFEGGYIVCYLDKNIVHIKEMVCPQNIKNKLALSAINYYNADSAVIREKADKLEKNITPFGMIKKLKPINLQEQGKYLPYISLVLD